MRKEVEKTSEQRVFVSDVGFEFDTCKFGIKIFRGLVYTGSVRLI